MRYRMRFQETGTNWLTTKQTRQPGPQDQQEWPERNPTTGSLSTAKLAPFFAAADTCGPKRSSHGKIAAWQAAVSGR